MLILSTNNYNPTHKIISPVSADDYSFPSNINYTPISLYLEPINFSLSFGKKKINTFTNNYSILLLIHNYTSREKEKNRQKMREKERERHRVGETFFLHLGVTLLFLIFLEQCSHHQGRWMLDPIRQRKKEERKRR